MSYLRKLQPQWNNGELEHFQSWLIFFYFCFWLKFTYLLIDGFYVVDVWRQIRSSYFDFTLTLLATSKKILQQQLVFSYPLNGFDEVWRYRSIQPMFVLDFLNTPRQKYLQQTVQKLELKLMTVSFINANDMDVKSI